MTAIYTQRDLLTRLGNWHDVVDNEGNGSLLAVIRQLNLSLPSNGQPTYRNAYDRDLRNRFGNWNDIVDGAGNGSFIAQAKSFVQVLAGAFATRIAFEDTLHNVTYNVRAGDSAVDYNCTTAQATAIFVPNTAPGQVTMFVKNAGTHSLVINDGTNDLYQINDVDIPVSYKDFGNRLVKVS